MPKSSSCSKIKDKVKVKVNVTINVESGFQCIFFSVKTGPKGCLRLLFRRMQTRLQKVEEQTQTQTCKARMLYRKEVFCWFLLNLCAFVSSCSINLLSLKLSLIILFRFERFLVRRTITNIQL